MEITVKAFHELTARELFDILQVRIDTFVVEQHCAYREADDADLVSLHITLRDGDGICAYARAIPPGVKSADASVGRVLAVKRRQGYATAAVREALRAVRERFGAEAVTIEAQSYVKALYEKLGFVQVSGEFLDDGIPHVRMRLIFDENGGERT